MPIAPDEELGFGKRGATGKEAFREEVASKSVGVDGTAERLDFLGAKAEVQSKTQQAFQIGRDLGRRFTKVMEGEV